MALINLLHKTEKLVIDNSPSILTGNGVVGVVVTAYLAGTASVKASWVLDEERKLLESKHTPKNVEIIWTKEYQLRKVWKLYIPAVSSGVLTIAAIVAANKIGSHRAAALSAAYSLSEKAFSEYKAKVQEKLGERKEQIIHDEVAQDRVNRNPANSREIIVTGKGEVLCHESLTGRYFYSDMESLRRAENDINRQIIAREYASLSEFFSLIGLPSTDYSEEVGWTNDKPLELRFSSILSEDGKPGLSIQYIFSPIRNYYRQN